MATRSQARHSRVTQRGQVLALFAVSLFVITGMVAVVIDISWVWANSLKVQRAADAAALAGVVYLPGSPSSAYATARAEAAKNGYADGGATTVTPSQDAGSPRQLNVTISTPVDTFFARLFGLDQITVTQHASAEYARPVPMGSPQSYLGIYQQYYYDSQGHLKTKGVNKAPGAPGGNSLASQGFWTAVITRGGQRSNGDAYSPQNNGSGPNAQYDPAGYSYTVQIYGTNGRVYLYDADFCAVGHAIGGTYLGTGDHWIGNDGGSPVTTQYTLWNTRDTPFDTGDDFIVADTGGLFANQNQVDKSTEYTGDGRYADNGYDGSLSADCSASPNHNDWYELAQGLAPGTYRLQVTTSSAGNIGTNAENMFGIQAVSSGNVTPRVYGTDRMAMYNNLDGNTSLFYLAQVDATNAGKTMEIDLFDPGDVGGNATLRLKQPTKNGYVDATFSYVADNGRSGNNVTSLQTASNGTNLFNNSWITITVPLPNTYGQGNDTLKPPGESEAGWWKVQYDITALGNDTTTWAVSVVGNPVHLVP
jgi:hypothetical protein